MIEMRDEFLSEEDIDLASLSDDELDAWWTEWLRLAQATNEEDKDRYSHGVFAGYEAISCLDARLASDTP